MNKSMSTYYRWVDIIKGTAIIGVVLSHITHPFKKLSFSAISQFDVWVMVCISIFCCWWLFLKSRETMFSCRIY